MAIPSFFRRNPGCGRYLMWGVILVAVLIVFRAELRFGWDLVTGLPEVLSGQEAQNFPTYNELIWKPVYLLGFAVILAGLAVFLSFLVSESALPIRTSAERSKVRERWRDFSRRGRAPLYVVREGLMVKEPQRRAGDPPEKQSIGKGVARVDQTSAIVLERQWSAGAAPAAKPKPGQTGKITRFPLARVGRPGVVFIQGGEKIRGVVSLRKQTRVNPGILGQTKDGIEVKTTVVTIFTVSQPPDVVKVAYVGDPIAENLRVLVIDPSSRRIKSIVDELEQDDKEEIDRFAQEKYLPYSDPNVPLDMADKAQDRPPYFIDDERLMAAVYSQGRDVNDSKVDSWTDLPPIVATGVFRNLISQETFDGLVNPDEMGVPRYIRDFKPLFMRKLRHQGVMSYQFVHRKDEGQPKMGDRVAHRDYRIGPVQPLTAQRLLRDRGIKVMVATFGELAATSARVPEQRLDNWSARWESAAGEALADYELEEARIRNSARAEVERAMIKRLLEVVQSSEYSEEAVTLLVLQALEQYAQDPNTRRMLPSETFNSLRNLRLWLVEDEIAERNAIVDGKYSLLHENTTQADDGASQADQPVDPNATEVA